MVFARHAPKCAKLLNTSLLMEGSKLQPLPIFRNKEPEVGLSLCVCLFSEPLLQAMLGESIKTGMHGGVQRRLAQPCDAL